MIRLCIGPGGDTSYTADSWRHTGMLASVQVSSTWQPCRPLSTLCARVNATQTGAQSCRQIDHRRARRLL